MPSLVTLFLCFKHLRFLFPFLFHIADKQNEYQMFSGYIAMRDYCWLHSFILFSLLYSQIVHSILVLIAPAPTYKNHHPTLLKGRQLWCIFPISLACPLLLAFRLIDSEPAMLVLPLKSFANPYIFFFHCCLTSLLDHSAIKCICHPHSAPLHIPTLGTMLVLFPPSFLELRGTDSPSASHCHCHCLILSTSQGTH